MNCDDLDYGSDAFSGGSEDEDGMFDIFTGEVKGTDSDAGFSDAADQGIKPDERPQPYECGSLKGINNIRVLDIEPSEDFEAPLRATLRLTSLHDPCEYLAVSYAWGPLYADGSHLCETLYIDERPLKVTEMLHSALRRVRQHWMSGQLRLKSAPLTVWIDAGCIDQTNQAEQGHQVSLMDRIFGSCYALIIYLGENSQDTGERRLFESPSFLDESARILRDTRKSGPPENQLSLGDYELRAVAFRSLLARPWFTRLWVVQEVSNGFGYRTRMIVGDFVLIGEALRSLMAALPTQQSSLMADGHDSIIDCPLPPPFFVNRSSYYDNVLGFMQQCNRLHCYDEKDRVYALLGAFKHSTSDIKADYSKTAEQIYSDFASEQLRAGHLAQLLACALSREPIANSKTDGLPSWVPDWRPRLQYHSKSHEEIAKREMKNAKGSYVTSKQVPQAAPRLVLVTHGRLLRQGLLIASQAATSPSQTVDLTNHWDFLSSMPLSSANFEGDTARKMLPSLAEIQPLWRNVGQVVSQLAPHHQYLFFFDGIPGAFVLRLRERYLSADAESDTTHDAYELISWLGVATSTGSLTLRKLGRRIPLATVNII